MSILTKCLFRLEQSWKYLHNIKTFRHSLGSLPRRIFALQCLPYILRRHVKTDTGQWKSINLCCLDDNKRFRRCFYILIITITLINFKYHFLGIKTTFIKN